MRELLFEGRNEELCVFEGVESEFVDYVYSEFDHFVVEGKGLVEKRI